MACSRAKLPPWAGCLRVPSAIVADESNYLLNPLHADFTKIRIGKARAFVLDGRFRMGAGQVQTTMFNSRPGT